MKIFFVINARMPTTKAYGIQAAKMCEAFARAGADVELIIPRTRDSRRPVGEFYGLSTSAKTTILWAPDWYAAGRLPFFISSLVFTCAAIFYLRRKRKKERGVVYTVDMDTFSFALLPLSGMSVLAEMHTPKPRTFLTNSFFSRAYTIATQGEIAAALQKTFAIPQEKLLIEPNGVDLEAFGRATSKQEARQALGLPQDAKIVLYAGRFYGWKSLSILAQAARLLPSIRWQTVGGNEEEYISATGVSDIPPNLHFAGLRSVDTVPVWIAAADVALVLGTKENENSYRFTAPMKVFEYMAVRRPVIASATPALKSFVPQDDVMWYEPDDASSLENAVSRVLEEYSHERLERAFIDSQKHTWDARAERIYVWIRNMLNFAHDR